MSGFDSSVIVPILSLLLIFLLNIKIFMTKASKQHFPPGSRPLPIIGNLHILNLKRPYQTMLELSQKYGSIYSIQMGPKKVVVLSGYETVKAALVNYGDQYGERSQVPIFERLFEGKGKPFEVKTVMNASVANVIVSVLLGKRFDDQDTQFLRLLTLIGENVKLVGGPRIALFNMFPVLGFLLKSHKTVLRNRDELFAFIRMTFLDHQHKFDKNDPRSFIDAFLVRQQEEKDTSTAYFSDENLVALVSYLLRFAAGTETVASTLCWALLLVMRYPEVQKKVCDEITKVVGSAQPRIAHRTQMPYTDAVIQEVQRFADILPTSLPHATTTDVIFKNYYIPKGTEVTTLLTSVLRDQAQWEKSDTFNPEHFLSSTGKFIKKEVFMPFSVGRRMCAGESLAKMELFLFFTSLMQKFTFQPPPRVSHRDLDLTPDIGFNTRPMPHKLCALLQA
ncbi:hypothetical protein GH733_000430 [Mirounga leonina]|nr:hypothetical protein GH733_000430 [Mirounga leonina]